jgi:cyclopropane-fatty-acyl-phospholipid synthase
MSDAEAKQVSITLLEQLIGPQDSTVGFRFWDGTQWPDTASRGATVVLKHPGALRAMFLPGTEVGLGESYLYDDIDIEGSVEAVFGLAGELTLAATGWGNRLRLGRNLWRLPVLAGRRDDPRGAARLRGRQHSVERDQQAISYHYDVSNDFYGLWLDQQMVYSCACFRSKDDDLDTAQTQKLEYICRKLGLKQGQRLLDIGCGWGGLVMYAAQHYGVDATGITLSKPQAELASERIAAAGLGERCRVLIQDYRQVSGASPYDALVSVGMFEHVGQALLERYFDHAFHMLRPGGVFLNHGIANTMSDKPIKGPSFSEKYVFPDGELVPINVTLRAAEKAGMEVRDVESLREHYMMTLRHWVRRLERNHENALRYVSEPTYRVWRLFMSGSAYGFDHGHLNVYQALLVKPGPEGRSGLSLTREDWYRPYSKAI